MQNCKAGERSGLHALAVHRGDRRLEKDADSVALGSDGVRIKNERAARN